MSGVKQGWRPKDGPGPRGVPDCYYTSRVLDSTQHYVSFVNRLRQTERKQREADGHALQERKNNQLSEFCVRTDRKNCINSVARKVDLCLESYEDDLDERRDRLRELLAAEEEQNIRLFVEQTQAGVEAVRKDKEARLDYLRAKKKKEQEDKYKDIPLSKSPHARECVSKMRVYEEKAIQLYQIREKQARKMAHIEFDKMWHEVAMKEAEALGARQEYDAMERYRRDVECLQYSDYQLEQKRIKRNEEQARLKEETVRMRQQYEDEDRKAAAEGRTLEAKQHKVRQDIIESLHEREELLARQKEEQRLIQDTFDSLTGQSNEEIRRQEQLRKRKEVEVVECNKRIIELKALQQKELESTETVRKALEQKQRNEMDERRCIYERKRLAMSKEARDGIKAQMAEHLQHGGGREQRLIEQQYNEQVNKQLDELAEHRRLEDGCRRKQHQQHLLDQIAYQRLLKERAEMEEKEQVAKYKAAEKQFREDIHKMMDRPFFSDDVHPFTKQIAHGLSLQKKCPCSKAQDFCSK